MAVNVNAILRPGAEVLIPEEQSKEIIQGAVAQSTVLSMFKRLPNMSSKVTTMPVLDLLPIAYFVDGDVGQKQTTKMEWGNKKLHAEEIAAIVPIPDAVLDDARDNGYDIWGEVKPRIIEAIGKVIDGAILYGINKPSSWRDDVVTTATKAGAVVTETGDLFIDIFGENGVEAKIENSGFIPTGSIAQIPLRGKLRGLRDDNKQPIFMREIQSGVSSYALDGMPTYFQTNGVGDANTELIMGDMSQAVYAFRQDITFKLLDQAIIQNPDGSIAYNLAQQDMTALRVVCRLGWEIPNPINSIEPDESKRTPFAILQKA